MKKIQIAFYLLWAALFFTACEPKIDIPEPGTGTGGGINITNYIAIGNSLSAGYSDGGLYLEGQKVAWPVILAGQFKLAGGGEFYAPLYELNQAKGLGYKKLIGFTATGSPIIVDEPGSPEAIKEKSALAYDSIFNPDSILLQPFVGPNNNFGVPGIRVEHIYTPRNKNPYYSRLLSPADYLDGKPYAIRVIETNPTFFTCWLGNNDVLGFSTAGGYPDLGKLTPLGVFANNYNRMIDDLLNSANSPKGAVANIPDVTSIPYFTSVGPALKVGLSAARAPVFLEYHLDSMLSEVIVPRLFATPPLPLLDSSNVRPSPVSAIATLNPMTKTWDGNVFFTLTFAPYAGDVGKPTAKAWRALFTQLLKSYGSLIPIPLTVDDLMRPEVSGIDSTKPFGLDPANPIPDVFVLNAAETAQARAATAAYNQVIQSAVDRHPNKLVMIDANAYLARANAGLVFDGIGSNASFISGGIFSLDGVHLTPRGNAAAANEFISGINKKFGSTIPPVNVGSYRGVRFP